MTILPTVMADLPVIRELFSAAIQYQKLKFGKHWHGLNEVFVEKEITECGYVFCGFKKFDDDNNPLIPGHYLGPGLSLYERKIIVG